VTIDHVPQAKRSPARPLIEPRTGSGEKFWKSPYWWEQYGTFNPGVAEYRSKVLLLYRAYDIHYVSRFGLAESVDGVSFQRRELPVVDTDPNDPYERLGIEDPRITKMDGIYYILHTSASYHPVGHHPDVFEDIQENIPWRVRVGMRTTREFRTFRRHGVILSDVPAKNACLLPERIRGAFALYYQERGDLALSYTRNFRRWFGTTLVPWVKPSWWETKKFGTGSQPIATKEGFLMVYHGVDQKKVYRLGLMLFDRKDPSKILWRIGPILEPKTSYEKRGYIANVVYTCGAVIRGGELWIYYGAADRAIARAVLPLKSVPNIRPLP